MFDFIDGKTCGSLTSQLSSKNTELLCIARIERSCNEVSLDFKIFIVLDLPVAPVMKAMTAVRMIEIFIMKFGKMQ